MEDREVDIEVGRGGDYFVAWHIERYVWNEISIGIEAVVGGWAVIASAVAGNSVVGTFVREDGYCIGNGIVRAADLRHNVEPVAVDGLISVDNDVVTLAYANEQPVSRERYNGYEVHCDDSHVMLVEADLEVVISAGVDETKSVLLSFLNSVAMVSSSTLGILVCAIDEDIVGRWILSNDGTRELVDIGKSCLIEPVLHRENAEVDIVIGSSGAINNDWTKDTVRVLRAVMTMVPRSAILGCNEPVCL